MLPAGPQRRQPLRTPFCPSSSDNRVADIGFAWDQVNRICYVGRGRVKAGNAKGSLEARKVLTEMNECFRPKPLHGRSCVHEV